MKIKADVKFETDVNTTIGAESEDDNSGLFESNVAGESDTQIKVGF